MLTDSDTTMLIIIMVIIILSFILQIELYRNILAVISHNEILPGPPKKLRVSGSFLPTKNRKSVK